MEEKHFLHAAETLGGSCALLDGRLRDIDGLKGLRKTFEQLNETLYCTIIEEITKQLYAKPCSEAINDVRRTNVMPKANGGDTETLVESTWNTGGMLLPSCAPGGAAYAALMDEVPSIADNCCALEDLNDEELTSKPVQYIAVLVDSLGLMGLLDRASRQLVETVEDQLWSVVVYRTSKFICDHLHGSSGVSGEARSLAELLRLLFVQFRFITAVYGVLIGQFERVLELRHQKLDSRFNVQTMWDQVQLTIERLLSMYLNVKPEQQGIGRKLPPDNDAKPISTYFIKKGPLPPRRRLFGFDGTAFAEAYHSERKPSTDVSMSSAERGEVACICRPGPQNIKAAFRLVMRFVSEIEAKISNPPCRLRVFVNSYIKKSFLPNLREDVVQKARSFLLDRSDTWNRTTSSITVEEQAAVLTAHLDLPDSPVPLFISTLKALDCCHDVVMILSSTPSFCAEFFRLWLQIVTLYLQSASAEYGSLSCSPPLESCSPVSSGSPRAGAKGQQGKKAGEGRKISSAWATDGDISRLLKSLPNWQSLASWVGTPAATPMVNCDGSGGSLQNGTTLLGSSSSPPKIESADEIRSRNSRESEILMGNLGSQAKIETSELLLFDARRFRLLANFQESVEYFCRCSRSILASLPPHVRSKLRLTVSSVDHDDEQLPQSDHLPTKPLVNGMTAVSPMDEFLDCLANIEQLASTCLLMLHLEARVHCFYHLLPLIRQPMFFGSSQEVDDQVIHLNKDLIRLNEILSGALQAPKQRYIFEGLGHLISTIFISGCQYIVRISDTGKKRICRDIFSVQQCLSDLTGSREPDLDQARRFYELLYKSPDDILNAIVEGGAEFAVTDYANLLALSIRSHPVLSSEPGALEQRLSRLKTMLTSDKRHL
ncbi:hypothetical protein TTRE_0000090601 [Trichuris trichiura]|uniref:Exocyst complex component Sec8 n=1 Tax=Trichuris trichiura TaxID=36087 RepID=A0A077YY54_TRITR|nr:hypothetical protein TTRE_0000090601 [Trichuris trichiura]